MLTDQERALLRRWQAEPELSAGDLAAELGLPPATVARRIERLRENGVLRGVHGVIDWKAAGYKVEVSLRFTLDKAEPRALDRFLAAAREVPEVIEIQTFLGRVDARLQVIARDLAHWRELYRDRILTLPHIADIEALMHVTRVKTDAVLPV
ncbi:Lrp/AsnC family transcriptional regulator [Jannaschia seohaensis]|uniref:Lrp/AsnC family transcriptional regulator n=1 Tax=Jannaschia seohaensis TaxID=475081 RepID=A0A2Y9ABA3_9RHOB|nr:Lrp/AsnC family transcriptional regulator [Jannaschia seohaensis]PWJ21045.1 Lrp/AsnC family transcriptional regulator [Jannaschia seohaensis]SSA41455.1 Lrp/AsnC family transcriptional regulator [Jannaschia seohaensis]